RERGKGEKNAEKSAFQTEHAFHLILFALDRRCSPLGSMAGIDLGLGCDEKRPVIRRRTRVPTKTLKAALAPARQARRPAGVFGFIWGRSIGITSRWMTPRTSAVTQAPAKAELIHPERLEMERL